MATTRGVNNTLAQQGPNFAPVTGGDGGGKAASFYDERTLTASDVQNGIVIMGPDKALKKGDRVIGMQLMWGTLGAGVTLAVGDDGSANRYITATAAAAPNAAPQQINVITGFGYQLTQDRDLQVTIGGAAPAAGQKIAIAWQVLRA